MSTAVLWTSARGLSTNSWRLSCARLGTFAEDWNSPEMDVYDDYDAAKSKL